MSARGSFVLESMRQRDARIRRERFMEGVGKFMRYVAVAIVGAGIGAAIAFPYGVDYAKERMAVRADRVRPGFDCANALRICENQLREQIRRPK